MPSISAEALRERLRNDLPEALAPSQPRVSTDAAAPAAKGKAREGPADLLATNDIVVVAACMPDVARYLRDTLGYELLSTITVVDVIAEDLFEVVYHFFALEGGPALVIKTRVPRDQPDVPSITPFWPGASLQEREGFDLYGVNFIGHPYLKRVYMWDEFEGYPMRKDFPRQGDKYLEESDE